MAPDTPLQPDEQTLSNLLAAAGSAVNLSYSPYSGTRVGVALLTVSGRIWLGANIGNSCSTMNCCAEQAAITQAVLAKDYPFTAIAIVQSSGEVCPPCGRCLQLLAEFATDMIIVSSGDAGLVQWSLSYLLPVPFRRSEASS